MFRETKLKNGLKMILAPLEGTKTVTILMLFGTGSKYESLASNGLSHFLEHMFFKGTAKRPRAIKISSELDTIGCEYNAFTAKEYTGYWIKVDSAKADIAFDILSDMLLNSKFSPAEIEREKGVIIEEINMYHDNPVMYIEDVFEKCLYGDTPAGREIAGPKENIRKFKRQDFLNYFSSQYGVNSGVLCLAGRIDQRSEALAEKYFGKFRRTDFKDKLGTPEAQSEPQIKIHVKDGDQVNLSLGVRTGNTYHPDRFILRVLSVVLGGSMSSRLFTEIREKRGLAYFIQTQTEFYTDTGYLTTRAGVPEEKTEEAIKTILVEYRRLKNRLVSESELRRAKDLIRGRTIIGFEESDAVANWLGRQAVLKEKLMSADEFFARIEAVKAEDLRRAARDIFRNEKLNLALIGPFRNYDPFRKILKL